MNEYKQKYIEVKKIDPLNPKLEEIKRDFISGRKSESETVKRLNDLEQELTKPL